MIYLTSIQRIKFFTGNRLIFICKVGCFLLLTTFPFTLKAQESLSLDKVWEIALQNNLTLKQQEKSIQQTQEEIDIQQTGHLPALSFNSYYNYQSELAQVSLPFKGFPGIQAGVYHQYNIYALIQQPVFKGFRTANLILAAGQKSDLQTLQQIQQRNMLLLQSGQLFFDLHLNILQQDVLKESINRTILQLQRLRNLLDSRQISAFDTLEIANHHLDLLNRLLVVQDQNKILQSKLEYLLNTSSLPGIDRNSSAVSGFILKSLEEYRAMALEKRVELSQISVSGQLQQTNTRIIKASYYPQINAQVSYHYARPGVNYFKDEWMNYYIFNLTMQWELWNWNRDAIKVQQARLEQEKLDMEYQKLVNDIQQQVREVYLYLQSLAQQILLQKRLVEQEKERYRITQEKYQQGMVTSLDLNTSEHALTEAQLRLQEIFISWKKYKIQLDYVCGTIGVTE